MKSWYLNLLRLVKIVEKFSSVMNFRIQIEISLSNKKKWLLTW